MSDVGGARFFTLKQGKASGPHPKNEILEEIKKGQISAFDLIYREHDEKWLPAHQISEFFEFFKGVATEPEEPEWVVLRLIEGEGGRRYLQEGPYTTALVKERLSDGRLSYRDFIWQKGSEGWRRIAALIQFNPTAPTWSASHHLLEDALDELARELEGVEEVAEFRFQKAPPPQPQSVPPEAVDLSESSHARPSPPVRVRSSSPSPSLTVPQRTDAKRFLKWGVVGLLILGLGVSAYLSLPHFLLDEVPESESVSVSQSEPVAPSQAEIKKEAQEQTSSVADSPKVKEEPAPKPPPPEKIEVKREPTWLKVKVLKGGQLSFSTDGSSHFPVNLIVIGQAGDILDQVSLVKEVKLRWKAGERRVWRPEGQGLPQGFYRFKAVAGASEAQGVFRLGKRNKSYRERLSRHRKLISLPFQREKRGLLMALEELEDQLDKNVSPASLRTWTSRNLKSVGPHNADKFVFPEVWMSVSERATDFISGKMSSSDLLRHVREEKVALERRKLFAD